MFLAGFLPMLILYRAKMWSMRRRLEGLEKQTASLHSPATDSADNASSEQPHHTGTP
jgi:hypothetical protein